MTLPKTGDRLEPSVPSENGRQGVGPTCVANLRSKKPTTVVDMPSPKEHMPTRLLVAVNLGKVFEKTRIKKESITIMMRSTGALYGALDASRAPTIDSLGRICALLDIVVADLFIPLDVDGEKRAAELLPRALAKMQQEKNVQRRGRERRG